jgi:hypothetical protein
MGIETRSGKRMTYGPEHYGRVWNQYGRKKQRITLRPVTRQQTLRRVPLPSNFTVSATPPDIIRNTSRLRTAKERPTCSDYGLDRYWQHEGYFFCSHCSFWDSHIRDPSISKRIKRTSKRFACQANHQSWIVPTQHLLYVSF